MRGRTLIFNDVRNTLPYEKENTTVTISGTLERAVSYQLSLHVSATMCRIGSYLPSRGPSCKLDERFKKKFTRTVKITINLNLLTIATLCFVSISRYIDLFLKKSDVHTFLHDRDEITIFLNVNFACLLTYI